MASPSGGRVRCIDAAILIPSGYEGTAYLAQASTTVPGLPRLELSFHGKQSPLHKTTRQAFGTSSGAALLTTVPSPGTVYRATRCAASMNPVEAGPLENGNERRPSGCLGSGVEPRP